MMFSRWPSWATMCVASLVLAPAFAQPAYLAEMPSAERVRREIQGASPLDTLAQQAAAIDGLRQILQVRTERVGALADPASLTAEERALVESYNAASRTIFSTPNIEQSELTELSLRYATDRNFENALIEHFFSPSWVTDYQAAQARFNTKYAQQNAANQAQSATASGPSSSGLPAWLAFVVPEGEQLPPMSQVIEGLVKTLGALVIAVLLLMKWFRRGPAEED
jgi:hypothetical protein